MDNATSRPQSAPLQVADGTTQPRGPAPSASDSRRGMAYMLGAVVCFVTMVTFVKLLREHGMSTSEVMTWRMAPGLPVVWWLMRRQGVTWRPRRPSTLATRVVFGGIAMATYFWAVQELSLFANTSLQLTQPVFVALLAPWVLGERLGTAGVLAFGLALAGAVLVVFPRADGNTWVAAVPLLPAALRLFSSLCSALAHMFIRRTTRPLDGGPGDAPETVVLHFMGWVAVVAFGVTLATGGFVGTADVGLAASTRWAWIAAMAISGVAGQLFLSRAYASGRAPSVALMSYAAIPMSLGLDVVVWDIAANPLQVVGSGVMVIAGVLLVRGGSASK